MMLIYHPLSQKNRGLKEKFEHLAETSIANGKSEVQFFRYNGLNESEVFKTPSKLPALLFCKRIDKEVNEEGQPDFIKECFNYENIRNHMLRDSTKVEFVNELNAFMA